MPEDSDLLEETFMDSSEEQIQGGLKLSGFIDVETVASYREKLVDLIASNTSDILVVDLKGLEFRGTAVVTLLITAVREARKIQKEISFENCSEDLLALTKACGVAEILSLGKH